MIKTIIIGTYFGKWPVWFPAFLLSCAKNKKVQWLFFSDCEIPNVPYTNIKFEQMNLKQFNELASKKLGFPVRKNAYSQVDLQPAYGVIFEDDIQGYDFWGHCDIDVIWGDLRAFITDEILQNFDIVSPRKDFLAGHLTLWRNRTDINTLFRTVPAHEAILSSDAHYNFDESIISTHIKRLISTSACKLKVYWPEQVVVWFQENATPKGWRWENGKVWDAKGREHIYLHFQEAKKNIKEIDFQVGEQPSKFGFTRSGEIRSRQRSLNDILKETIAIDHVGDVFRSSAARIIHFPRLLKKLFLVKELFWAQELYDNSISAKEVEYDKKTKRLVLKRLGIRIGKQQRFVLKAYRWAVLLSDQEKVKFELSEKGELVVGLIGLFFSVQNPEDLSLLKELFVDKVYDTTITRPTVVLEVGSRGGLAAVRFASQPNVIVVSYEPSKIVYEQASRNLNLNPNLTEKIQLVPRGIGDAKFGTIAVHYAGTKNQSNLYSYSKDFGIGPRFEYEDVEVDDISIVIDKIVSAHPGRDIVLKLDLESSIYFIDGVLHYRVVDRLRVAGKLDLINTIIIRWRKSKFEHDPSLLAHELSNSGFFVFNLSPYHPDDGFLYAVRQKLLNLSEVSRSQ